MLVFDHTNESLPRTFGLSDERADELFDIISDMILDNIKKGKSIYFEFICNSDYTEVEKMWMYYVLGLLTKV